VIDWQRPDCLQGLADRLAQRDRACCRAKCPIAPGLPVENPVPSHKFQHAKPGAARTLLWHAKGISAKIETGRREARPMDFKDRRIWYAVAAVIIVLIITGYATGWFGGVPAPAPQQ
jgi:hypothetical protein